MASVDDRVVQMTFKSAEFQAAGAAVLSLLQRLKSALGNLKGGESALNNINTAGKNLNLSHIGSSVDTIASKFSALGVVATAALATIATRAAMAAGAMLKSFTIGPVIAGLHEYENELNTTAVILANTGLEGEAGMAKVKAALDELNTYADKTIYSFEDMTTSIGKFTAAGVSLKDSVASIKGLSNLAALSGSSAQQAAVAQLQLSQAIAAGTVKLEDWNSVVNAGMGGKVFQNALIQTARAHGANVDQMIKKNGSFRLSLQEGWLTSKVLLDTLSTFTGDLNKKQLKSMGYTDAQIAQIQKQAQAAVDAATKVRTLTQMMSTVGEAVQSAWAGVWRAVFGNMEEATKLWTAVGGALTKAFVSPVANLEKLLTAWNKLGGRTVLIDALSDAFKILGSVLKPIKDAFRDVFPPATVTTLLRMTSVFHSFVNSLKPSATTLANLHKVFEGFFSALKIGWDIVKGVIGVISSIFGAASGAGSGVLSLAAKFGTFLTNLRRTVESGTALTSFFRFLSKVLSAPVKAIGWLIQGLDTFIGAIGRAMDALKPFIAWVSGVFSQLGTAIANAIRSGDFSNVLNVLNQVLLGGVLLAIRNFFKNLGKGAAGGFGLFGSIKKAFGELTGALKAMQTNLNAGTLQKIAIAVALLAASLVALSFIDAAKLAKSLSAMTVMFTELLAAMAVVTKISTGAGIVKMGAVAGAMNLMATAILILSGAVAILAQLSWTEIAKGLGSVAAMMAIFVVALNAIPENTVGLVAASFAMTLLAVAMNLMAGAVALLGRLDWTTLLKGVGTIAALLAVVGLFTRLSKAPLLISEAAAMILLGAALNVIAQAIKSLGSLSVGTLAKGLIAIAGGLLIIAGAMHLMPASMFTTAAGLLVVSAALVVLSKALTTMGKMSWGEIAKSLVTLAGALVIIAVAVTGMFYALPGAAALIVIAGALAILVPVLIALGSMSWGSIAKGLIALAGAFIIIAAAGLLMAPIALILLAVGAAIVLMGAGMLAAGVGISLFAAGLGALGVALTASGAAILSFVKSILSLLPLAMQKFGEGVVAFAQAIAKGAPAMIGAFSAILTALLQALIKNLPLILKVFDQLLAGFLGIIKKYAPQVITLIINLMLNLLSAIAAKTPQFVSKGADIIIKFLNGIANKLPDIIAAGANIIIKFIQGIGSNMLKITQAAANTVINFVNGLANQIRTMAPQIGAAAGNLGRALVEGVISGITSMIPGLNSVLGGIGSALSSAWHWLTGSPSPYTIPVGKSLIEGIGVGLRKNLPVTERAARETGLAIVDELKATLSSVKTDMESTDLQPRITPVIDLTEVKRGFSDLASISRPQLSVGASISAAAAAASSRTPAETEGGVMVAGGNYFSFTQNNSSPKALSTAEIYRQTKNQLSVMRGALPV